VVRPHHPERSSALRRTIRARRHDLREVSSTVMWRSCALVAFALTGCGTGYADRELSTAPRVDAAPVTDTSAPDASNTDTAPGADVAPSGIPRCGPGPWILQEVELSYAYGTKGPAARAHASTDLCPEIIAESDERGIARLAVTRAVPFSLLIAAAGDDDPFYSPQLSAFRGTRLPFAFAPPPTRKGPVIDRSQVTLAVAMGADPARPSPCDRTSGLRLHVAEVAAAMTHYWIQDVETTDVDDIAIDAITIDGLPGDADVTVVAEKSGCTTIVYRPPVFTTKTRTHRDHPTIVEVEILGPIADAGVSDAGDGE
jgi:hypothetical protein